MIPATDHNLRDETPADEPFLRRLYAAIRWDETAAMGMADTAQRLAFLNMQFDLQRRHYRAHFADAQFSVIEKDDVPVGRLYLWRGQRDHRIIDISLLPERSGRGIGGRILAAVQAEAAAVERGTSLHVDAFNPARRLYHRIGFREVGQDGPSIKMEWFADGIWPNR